MINLNSTTRRLATWLRGGWNLLNRPRGRGAAARGKPLYLENYPSFGEFDREALRRLVRGIRSPQKRVLEIGSWLGAGSTRVFIEELKPGRDTLVCVDTWRGSPNVQKHLEIAEGYDLLGTFLYNVAGAGGRDLVKPMVMTSLDAAALLAHASFDLVFIDGDHSYSSTAPDIRAWRKKVAPGGVLCGHDCEGRITEANRDFYAAHRHSDHIPAPAPPFLVNHPGVILAVHEIFGSAAHLWAEEDIRLPDGRAGRATIWDVTIS